MKVVRQIGRGGFGTVDLVEDETGAQFARKTFSIIQPGEFPADMEDNVKRRFRREARIQSELVHHNIVPVLESDVEAEPPSFIMPLALATLDQEMAASKDLDGHFLEALMDILAGLEEIHQLDIYHRDLKPQNVLKLGSADNYRYAIGDFGLMSINDTQISQLTHTGMRMGSDFYTAPEIVADLRQASARSDIYSVGCILHDFVGTGSRIPCNEINDDKSPFSDIIRICTRKDPSRRFQTVADLRDAILEVDATDEKAETQEANDFIELLELDDVIDQKSWESIVAYVENNFENNDVSLLLHRVSLARVNEIMSLNVDLAFRLAMKYADWARNGTFDFSFCDGLANRLSAFYELENLTCKAEILLALLFLGTSHNRWYVERKFVGLAGDGMPDDLAKRFSLEVRVLGGQACRAFRHLEVSIGVKNQELHPTLAGTIKKVCAE